MKLALCMWDYRVFARFHEVHNIKTSSDGYSSVFFLGTMEPDEPKVDPKYAVMATAVVACLEIPGFWFHWFQMASLSLYKRHIYNSIAFTVHLCTSTQNSQIIIYLRLYIYVESALQFFPAEKMILIPSHFQQVFHRERLNWMGQAGNHPVVVPNHINMLEVGGSRGGFWSKFGAPEGLRYAGFTPVFIFLLKWISACAYSPI